MVEETAFGCSRLFGIESVKAFVMIAVLCLLTQVTLTDRPWGLSDPCLCTLFSTCRVMHMFLRYPIFFAHSTYYLCPQAQCLQA